MSNQEGSDKKQKSFWETAPGILAAILAGGGVPTHLEQLTTGLLPT